MDSSNLSEITIGEETISVGWKEGKLYCPHYNVENEKLALALRGGYGEGGGVFLVALNEMCQNADDVIGLCLNFEYNLLRLEEDFEDLMDYPSRMILPYLAYSPVEEYRLTAARGGIFSKPIWRRLLQDREVSVICAALERKDCWEFLNEELFRFLVIHPNIMVRSALALVESLPESIMIELSRDKHPRVRMMVAENLRLPLQAMKELALESHPSVLEALIANKITPNEVLQILLEKDEFNAFDISSRTSNPGEILVKLVTHPNVDVRRNLASNCQDPKFLSLLAQDEDMDVRNFVASNQYTNDTTLQFLANDKAIQVRETARDRKNSITTLERSI